jgi:hypothetical protein
MFRHVAIFRLYPVVLRENWFRQRPVIDTDPGGGDEISFYKVLNYFRMRW